MASAKSPYFIPAIGMAVRMLDFLRDGPGTATLTELCTALQVPKSSGRNVARTLEKHGLLEYDPDTRKFGLGAALLTYGAAAGRQDLLVAARPHLRALTARTRLTAVLLLRYADGYIPVDKVESPEAVLVTMQLGQPSPWRHGVLSRTFLAFMPPTELEALVGRVGLQALSTQAADRREFEESLRCVQQAGYAAGVGEFIPGVNAVAAPIFDEQGRVTLVVGLIGTAQILTPEALTAHGAMLAEIAGRLSAATGLVPVPG